MKTSTIMEEVNYYYPALKIIYLKQIKSAGTMNRILIARNKSRAYVVKIYLSHNLNKIINEHRILKKVNTFFPLSIRFLKNKYQQTYSHSKKQSTYFSLYEFIKGKALKKINNVSSIQIKNAAATLRDFHLLSNKCPPSSTTTLRKRDLTYEFQKNVNNLKKSLKLLNDKITPNKKEETIKIIITSKLRSISNQNLDEIKIISDSTMGIIHGDYAPTNLIYDRKGKVRKILDWENACIYNYAWDLFRASCFFSNESNRGIICSKLNNKKVSAFIDSYFSKKTVFKKKDISILRLMPKYYYFLDPFIITSYCLYNNKKILSLISTKISDHFWLENNINEFNVLISKYA